jgi:Mycothiol maleylpyruvate isomerase N-terminal domain
LDDVADDQWTTEELLRRVDAGRRWLDERLAEFPEETLDDPVGGGWTRRQMLQHLIVWHGLTAERLGEYQRTGQRPVMSRTHDEINAEAMKMAAGRSRADLLADLDSSFHALRDEVAKLRDDQLLEHEFWPGGVVVGNTFGHYEEHRADLTG